MKIEIEIPDGKKAEWVDGVLTLVDEKPIEYKFNIGDKVTVKGKPLGIFTIECRLIKNGNPYYCFEDCFGQIPCAESDLTLYKPQDITERIKTLEDACKWCSLNNYGYLVRQLSDVHFKADPQARDIVAYLKLRIITTALNEGWEPRCEQCEELWSVVYNWNTDRYCADWYRKQQPIPHKLALKSHDLAEYAATQFRDIYADFCGCKKGGEG